MSKKETLFFTLYSLSFLLFFFLFLYVFAWQEPTQNPPLSNVPAPINVSSISQIKSGRLGIMTDGIDTNYGLTVGNSSNPFGIKSSGNSYFERDLTILGNIILKDSSNNLDSLLSQGIIKEKFLPYCKQEITSDVYTNSQNQQTGCNFGGYTGYYDISNLTPENVKAGVTFGRGQVGSYSCSSSGCDQFPTCPTFIKNELGGNIGEVWACVCVLGSGFSGYGCGPDPAIIKCCLRLGSTPGSKYCYPTLPYSNFYYWIGVSQNSATCVFNYITYGPGYSSVRGCPLCVVR
jgi:hypothetical protein